MRGLQVFDGEAELYPYIVDSYCAVFATQYTFPRNHITWSTLSSSS